MCIKNIKIHDELTWGKRGVSGLLIQCGISWAPNLVELSMCSRVCMAIDPEFHIIRSGIIA